MDEELYRVLSSVAPTWHFVLDGAPERAIIYRMYIMDEGEHESGQAQSEWRAYRVTVNMREYDANLVERVVLALKGARWSVFNREQDYDPDKKYYLAAMSAAKWRALP